MSHLLYAHFVSPLKVLDLSFNMLTSLHPLMYLSLHNFGADVRLVGNRWQCDCSLRILRKWMVYDSSKGLQTWSITCASPSMLSGNDLLQLEENDLKCLNAEKKPELHQDVTVYSGSEILLSCPMQGIVKKYKSKIKTLYKNIVESIYFCFFLQTQFGGHPGVKHLGTNLRLVCSSKTSQKKTLDSMCVCLKSTQLYPFITSKSVK